MVYDDKIICQDRLKKWLARRRSRLLFHPLAADDETQMTSESIATPSTKTPSYSLTHLKQLEAESIHIIREVVAEFENPVMLYSIGKDSSVMVLSLIHI